MKFQLRSLIATTLLMSISSISNAAGFFAPTKDGSPLAKVHSAYLAGDFKKMTSEMKKTFEAYPNDPQVKENVFAVLQKAYEIGGKGAVPVDWSLPDDITSFKASVRITEKDEPQYFFKIYGNTVKGKYIKQLKVTRFPNQVILDKEAGVGEWEEERNNKEPDFGFQTAKSRQAIPGGLYSFYLEMADGQFTDGWFLMEDDINSTATPRVTVPASNEVFQTGNPTFRWADFTSPQYKNTERRSVWMGVSRSEAPYYQWDIQWEMFKFDPRVEEVIVGSPDGEGVNKLSNGNYVFVIKYNERRNFGDLIISRDSAVIRSFSVRQ